MEKFKKGDRVVVANTVKTEDHYGHSDCMLEVGQDGIVGGCSGINVIIKGYSYHIDDLVLHTYDITPEFTKGDVVYFNSKKYTVVRPYLKYELVNEYGQKAYRFDTDLVTDAPVKEVTMAELEAKFGMKVKVIK